jgi:hypothetical protein
MTALRPAKLHTTSGATGLRGRWTIPQPYLRAIVWRDANADDDLWYRRVPLVGHGDTAGVGGQRDCETQRQLEPARAAISSPPVSPATRV